MRYVINLMIFAGSALMIYNILRYGNFVKNSLKLESNSRRIGQLVIPLLLLIFFFVGYVIVGLTGMADLLIAGILLGGSIFVFMLLMVMFSIIKHIRTTDQILSNRYEEMRTELRALTEGSFAAFLVDLTTDRVLERVGESLYESDTHADSYTEIYNRRSESVIDTSDGGAEISSFRREELLRSYQEGQTNIVETVMLRDGNGDACYIQFSATLSTMPVSGDVIAFITEKPNNEEIIHEALLRDVLMDQYDRVACLIDGKYSVVISNVGKKTGLLFPDDEADTYESLYLNYILPAQIRDKNTAGPNPLRLSVIDKALSENHVYVVDEPFILEGEEHYKRISFYCIDRKTKFYLMLVSDSTAIQEVQMEQNRRLAALLEEATSANRARTRFFSRMSHDLRTPMNGILGFTSLARAEKDEQKAREYVDKIDRSGRRLLSMIDDMFAMSMIDGNTLHFEEAPTDLRELGEKLRERFADERPEKKIRFLLDTKALRDPVVLCDAERLSHALSRLLENSYAFVPENEAVAFTIRQLECEQPRMGCYAFDICNCGVEIPEDMLSRIFEVDAWDDSMMAGDLPGVGIGMAVAKTFIDRMGGKVTVRSGPESMTQFSVQFVFPILEQEQETSGENGLSLHILLVDDNAINREIAELMLTAEGWTVEQAENGAQAVELVTEAEPGHFDVVLMDVQMPIMNGYEATAAIRALPDPEKARIPIIAVTANAYQEDANEAVAAGMDGYVSKPIDPAAIRKAISKILGGGDSK